MRPDRLALIALALLAGPMAAQSPGPGTIVVAADFRVAPDGRVLGSLRPGAVVQTITAKLTWSQVAIDGWLHVSVFGPARDSFPLSVKSANGAIMRASADRNAGVVALLEDGMGLQVLQRSDQWAHVRRVVWVATASVKPGVVRVAAAPSPAPVKPAASATASPASAAALAPPEEPLPGDVAVARRTNLLSAPTGRVLGTLDSTTKLVTGPSERGWVRVTVEGWVRQADVIPLDSAPISSISAADLRADPDRYKGQTVRWLVQVVSYQTADPLRKGLRLDEPYLLARGPGIENSLLYLALPPSLIDMGRELKPLSTVLVLARVRSGRSEPSGVPILDLLRIIQR